MPKFAHVTGAEVIFRNIKLRKKEIASGMSRGLLKAGLVLQRESQRVVPVDTGNLKASAFTNLKGKDFGTSVTVGYTANYALYVHEAVEMRLKGQQRRPPAKGRYWDPQGRAQAKFLEEPARRMVPELRRIIREEARIK